MCGIVAVTGYKKALPLLINGLEKLEYRGYDSAGIAIINSETNSITCNKAKAKLTYAEPTNDKSLLNDRSQKVRKLKLTLSNSIMRITIHY